MRSRRIPLVIFITILITIFSTNGLVFGSVESVRNAQLNRIVFVIDCSNSMNANDPNKLTSEIVKMFVDASYSGKTEIGFVVFNDTIVNHYPLTPLTTESDRNAIKFELDAIRYSGSTDIGLALNTAMDLFSENTNISGKSAVVLLSDGETDLRLTRTGRTMADSLSDEAAAFEKSKELGVPIYAVGISRNGNLNTAYLDKIVQSTQGKKYALEYTEELLELFPTIFTDVTGSNVLAKQTFVGTGEIQSVTIEMPYLYSDESNIIIQHGTRLRNVHIEDENASLYTSSHYNGIKMVSPDRDSLVIEFTANAGDEVKINAIHYFDIIPVITVPQNLSALDIPIEATLYSLTRDIVLEEPNYYSELTAELVATDILTGELSVLPMENTGTSFIAHYNNVIPTTSQLQVRVNGQDYAEQSPTISVSFTNTPPIQTGSIDSPLLRQNRINTFDLNDYFKDVDGDTLSFELVDSDNILDIDIQEQTLHITPKNAHKTDILVTANDGRGGVITGSLMIEVVPFWIYYRSAFVTIGIIFCILMIGYLLFTRKTKAEPIAVSAPPNSNNNRFNGARFEGYFLNTLSGKEVPILNWNASYIENKHMISLGEMLNMLDVTEKLPEAHKLFFQAGSNGTVIFHHNTDCVISIGRRNVSNGKKEVLNFDDKIYIVFEDHTTEIEIRYKRVRKLQKIYSNN